MKKITYLRRKDKLKLMTQWLQEISCGILKILISGYGMERIETMKMMGFPSNSREN